MGVTGRVDRIDVDAGGRALVRDYKGRTVTRRRALGAGPQAAGALYALAARELLGLEPAGALYQPVGPTRRAPARARPRRRARPLRQRRRRRRRGVRVRARGGARRSPSSAAADLRAGRIRACPELVLWLGDCAYPGICRAGEGASWRRRRDRARRRAESPPARSFTAEQRAAIDEPLGLGAAGRQRRLRQDRRDGRAVRRGRAAGRRGGRLGPRAHVHREGGGRAARARPPAVHGAGGDRARARDRRRLDRHHPRLLRPRAARAAARRRASIRASRCSTRRRRAASPRPRTSGRSRSGRARAARRRSISPPPTGRVCATCSSPRTRRCAAAASRIRGCRSRPTRGAGSRGRCAARRARRCRRRARGRRRQEGRGRARGAGGAGASATRCRGPASSTPRSSSPARRRSSIRRAWTTARPGRPTAAPAPTTTRARRSRCSTTCSTRFGTAYDAAKAARAGVDFSDLELRVRDLLADPRRARQLGRAVRADHGRRVPGHEPAPARRAGVAGRATTCSRSATSSSRSTASATPTSRSSASCGRAWTADRVRRLTRNFRSGEELLDVLNGAFAPELGRAVHAAGGGRAARCRADDGRCGCSTPIP